MLFVQLSSSISRAELVDQHVVNKPSCGLCKHPSLSPTPDAFSPRGTCLPPVELLDLVALSRTSHPLAASRDQADAHFWSKGLCWVDTVVLHYLGRGASQWGKPESVLLGKHRERDQDVWGDKQQGWCWGMGMWRKGSEERR